MLFRFGFPWNVGLMDPDEEEPWDTFKVMEKMIEDKDNALLASEGARDALLKAVKALRRQPEHWRKEEVPKSWSLLCTSHGNLVMRAVAVRSKGIFNPWEEHLV